MMTLRAVAGAKSSRTVFIGLVFSTVSNPFLGASTSGTATGETSTNGD
jgi:hypothetical protein